MRRLRRRAALALRLLLTAGGGVDSNGAHERDLGTDTKHVRPPITGRCVRAAHPDLLVTLDAEDAFDVEDQLGRVMAATLVIGGGKDAFCTASPSRPPPLGVRDGRVHIFEGWGHARTSGSGATTHLTLGFLLAGLPLRPEH